MKTSQTIEIWKKFLKEQRELEEEVLEEEEPFQKAVKKGYLKKRDQYTTTGPQKTGGAPFDKNPKRSRSKSAPPAGLPVAEENELDEVSINFLEKIPGIGRAFTKEKESDQETGNEPVQSGEQVSQVNIELPVPQEKKADILNDTEVRKLLSAFFAKWDINDPDARNEFSRALKLSPNAMIKNYTYLAGVNNTATQEDEKEREVKPDNPDAPTAPEIKKTATSVSIEKEILPTFQKEFGFARSSKYKDALKNLSGVKITDLSKGEISTDSFLKLARNLGLEDAEAKALTDMAQNKKIVKENLSINNVSGVDLAKLIQNINKFYPYAQEYLKFDRPVSLNLVSDPDNAKDTFGKTAYYNPNNDEITIFVDKRHPKDMIRSFSHELVHHAQNCRGEFDKDFVAGENYIEENDHLNLMEREAYEKGNMCLRYYESYLKKENKKMSLNEETLRKAIREAIKRVTENTEEAVTEEAITEDNVEEAHCPSKKRDDHMEEELTVTEDSGEEESEHDRKNVHDDDYHIKEIERHLDALKSDRDYEEKEEMDEGADKNTGMSGMDGDDKGETYMGHMKEEDNVEEAHCPGTRDDEMKEETIDEDEDYTAKKEKPGDDKRKGAEKRGAEGTLAKTKGHGKVDYVNEEKTISIRESLNKEKGNLIFDRLVNKWCK